jgi:hypothetical protein
VATSLLYLGPCLGPYSILGIASLGGVVAIAVGWVGGGLGGIGTLVARGRVEAVAAGNNC